MSDISQPPANDPWDSSTFEGAELATLRQAAKLTLAEKLAWLEQAHQLALKLQESRRAQGLKTIFPDGHTED